jgi:hypothetical protein
MFNGHLRPKREADLSRPRWTETVGKAVKAVYAENAEGLERQGLGSYRAPTSSASIGRISVRFTGTAAATLTLPQGRSIALTRFSGF